MTYERIKTIKGRKYRYLVKGERVNGKVKQKVVKYLGAVEPVKERRRKRGAGRKPSIFARELTQEEKTMLEKKSRSSSAFERDRALILLYSSEHMDVKQICEKVSREVRTVRGVIRRFNETGLKVFECKKTKGAEPKFTEEQRARVLQAALTEPKKLDLHFTTWSLPKLRAYLLKSGIVGSISIETVRKILRSNGIGLKRSRRKQYSNDPEFSKKNSA